MAVTLEARLDVRLSRQLKELIQEAAELTGQSLTDFAVSTLTETARRIVQQNSMTVLSNRDRDVFLALLDADDPPNEALRKAAKRFRKRKVKQLLGE
jgi:uncharacterized protein (DUF1778 family)